MPTVASPARLWPSAPTGQLRHRTPTAPASRTEPCYRSQFCGPPIQAVRYHLDALTPTTLIIPAGLQASSSSRFAAHAHASGGRSAHNRMVLPQRLCLTRTLAIHLLKVKLHPIRTRDFSLPLPFRSL